MLAQGPVGSTPPVKVWGIWLRLLPLSAALLLSTLSVRPARLCCSGQKYTFTTKEGADGRDGRISVNYDGFIDDVSEGDTLLVDGGMLSLKLVKKSGKDVECEVIDGGIMASRWAHEAQRLCCELMAAACCVTLQAMNPAGGRSSMNS